MNDRQDWCQYRLRKPFASIHDSDGDGVPDSDDVAPNDPNIWASASATIIVTVQSGHWLFSVHYYLYLNDALKSEGDLAAGASRIVNIDVSWTYGANSGNTVVVMATSTGGGLGAESDQLTVTLLPNDTKTVTLTI